MKILPFTIELLEPVLVTSLDGDPNSGVSFDYLPGAALRGAIIGRYIAQQKRGDSNYELDAANETERRLFFSGQTRFLNGYICHVALEGNQVRALPLPRSLFVEKGEKKPVFDFAGDEHPRDLKQPKPRRTRHKGHFGLFEGTSLRDIEVQRSIAVHTARNRRFGRAMGGSSKEELTGDIYRYDALAPGQTFLAYILCQDEDAELLASQINDLAMLGGSRSAGYGQVCLASLGIQEAQGWNEVPYPLPIDDEDGEPVEVPAGRIIITLLSDALLRDNNGQYSVDPAAVCDALGLTLQQSLVFSERRPDGSFNRKWGLPTRQMPVFAMGSVFICDAPDAAALQALREIQARGFGEKRAEGFGRFAIDWYHGEQFYPALEQEVKKPAPIHLPEGSAARAVAGQVAVRLLEQHLDRYITAEAGILAVRQAGLQKSQIYRLQEQILTSLQEPRLDLQKDRRRLETYLENLGKRAVTRKQFARTRIEDKPRKFEGTIPDWIALLLKQKEFKGLEQYGSIKQIGDVAPQIDEALVYRTNLRLINEVLSRLAKLAKDD